MAGCPALNHGRQADHALDLIRATKWGQAKMLDDVVAPILYRILFGGRDLTPAYCRALLARALAR